MSPGPCHFLGEERFGLVSYGQATLATGLVSIVFACLIFAHEVAAEGGFDIRNYVVVAFCCVWLIVDGLLLLGTWKRAPFLLLPWMILICTLTPIFLFGVIMGFKVIINCCHYHIRHSCVHQRHIFGTLDGSIASVKLAMLIIMLIINTGSVLVTYRHFTNLSGRGQRPHQDLDLSNTEGRTKKKKNMKYKRFRDETEPEMNVPLCETLDDATESHA